MNLGSELKKTMEHLWQWCKLLIVCLERSQKVWKMTGGIGNQRKNCDYPDHCIFRSSRILRRVLKTKGGLSLRLQWETLAWKTRKDNNNNNNNNNNKNKKKKKKSMRLDTNNAQPRIHPGEWDAQCSLGFLDTNRAPNFNQTTRPSDCQKKKKKKKKWKKKEEEKKMKKRKEKREPAELWIVPYWQTTVN